MLVAPRNGTTSLTLALVSVLAEAFIAVSPLPDRTAQRSDLAQDPEMGWRALIPTLGKGREEDATSLVIGAKDTHPVLKTV